MILDPEIRLALNRIENQLQNFMELRDFRNFMLAKSYLEEGQIHTAIQFLNRIDKQSSSHRVQTVILQSLFIRALIMVYNLQFTEAMSLLVRIRRLQMKKNEQFEKDIESIIQDIKIQQQASVAYDSASGKESIEEFRENTLSHLQGYLASARELVKK